MKIIVTVNNLSELKAVAEFAGIEVKASEIQIAFPYPFEIDNVDPFEKTELTFEEFKTLYL